MKQFAVEYDVVEHVRYYTVISAESKDEVLEKLQNGDFEVQDEEYIAIIDNHDSWEPYGTEGFELQGVQCEELIDEND